MADPLTLEGLTLGATRAEVIAGCAARGWGHNIGASPIATVAVGAPIGQVLVTFEADLLVKIDVHYDGAQPARIAAAQAAFDPPRRAPLLGVWGAYSGDRQVTLFGNEAATSVTATYVGRLANRAEIEALFAMLA